MAKLLGTAFGIFLSRLMHCPTASASPARCISSKPGRSQLHHQPRRKSKIHRHKTALVCWEISKPVKTLLELGQLRRGGSFFDYRDFDKTTLPELLTRIKIDLKRLFVSVIDHTTGPEHQLLFFKERFLAKDHPDRPKMDRFSAKLRKLGLRGETIGYGPTKEKWDEWISRIQPIP